MQLQIRDKQFYLDDKPTKLYAGCIHYFRVPREYWRDRLMKLKAAGLNAVETYICWNLHEPKKGEYRFDGMLDVAEFLSIAQELGLYAIVRPGPYICAEWDFGGLPSWLLADKNIRLRCMDETYLRHVAEWYRELFARIGHLQSTRGGNIIAMQVENEYGSYANDKQYLQAIREIMVDCGCEVLMFTADGNWKNMVSGGGIDGVYKTLTFGSGAARAFHCLRGVQDDAPDMCMEFWDGWFDHWFERHHVRPSKAVIGEIADFLTNDANFNLYMFHGGTNFAFTAGANHGGKYQPTVTSYDYNAPLSEWGGYTPLYHALRKMMLQKRGLTAADLPLPDAPVMQNIGQVALTQYADLKSNAVALSRSHRCATPRSMEELGQNFGYMIYSVELQGKYDPQMLQIQTVHDLAYVYVNGELRKRFWRNDKPSLLARITGAEKGVYGFLLTGNFEKGVRIDILVDCMGRVNYGKELYDRKGIEDVRFGAMHLRDWTIRTLPMDNLDNLTYSDNPSKVPCFMRGTFRCQSKGDCFVHMDGFTKGFVTVNGHNLGRYWSVGPQKALYLPGCWLYTDRENEIVVFEQERYKSASVRIDAQPDLD